MQPNLKLETFTHVKRGDKGMPWEHVGTSIPKGASIGETLAAAGLDWEVRRLPLFVEIKSEIPIVDTDSGDVSKRIIRKKIPIDKSYALIRTKDNKVLSPYMGKVYKPIQNEKAFKIFDDFVRAGDMTMESAGSLSDGKHVWGLASINKGFCLANGETIQGYFLLVQSHLYANALRAMFTPIRFPGGNTLMQAINIRGRSGTYTMSHARKFDEARIQEIKELLGVAEENLINFRQQAEFLAETKLSEKEGAYLLTQIFDPQLINKAKQGIYRIPRNLAEIVEFPHTGRSLKKIGPLVKSYPGADLKSCVDTAWGYYNAIIYAYDQVLGHQVDTRLESAWLGKNAAGKLRALDLVMTMATARSESSV